MHVAVARIQQGSITIDNVDFQPNPFTPLDIPEPGTLALLATGAVGLLAVRRRRHPKGEPPT
jgi:hypothetical protein